MNLDVYKRKARFGRLYNLGGKGGSSQANTSTATTTTSSTNMLDQSMMGGDNAVGLNGNGNLVDKSVMNNTAFNDTSNNSTNFSDTSDRSTTFTDTSNNSTNFFDGSNSNNTSLSNSNSTTNFSDTSDHSVTTNYTSTDFGSVTKALEGMTQLSGAAVNLSGQVVKDGLKGLADQSKDNIAVLQSAFQFAKAATAADAQKYTDVLGFAKDAVTKTNDAYANAADGGTNKTLQIAAVATVAAVGLAIALKS